MLWWSWITDVMRIRNNFQTLTEECKHIRDVTENSTETLDIRFLSIRHSFSPLSKHFLTYFLSAFDHSLIPRSQVRGWTRDWSNFVNWSRGGGNWPRGSGTKQNKIWCEELEVICYRVTSFPIVFRIRAEVWAGVMDGDNQEARKFNDLPPPGSLCNSDFGHSLLPPVARIQIFVVKEKM